MKKNAFTLLEVMLTIAIIALISAIMIPVMNTYRVGDDLDVARNDFMQSLRRAQILAQASDGDISWGVKFQSGNITLFKGTSYASRDVNYDEVYDIADIISLDSGSDEIVFEKFTGYPDFTGDIQLSTSSNEIQVISINQFGMLDY